MFIDVGLLLLLSGLAAEDVKNKSVPVFWFFPVIGLFIWREAVERTGNLLWAAGIGGGLCILKCITKGGIGAADILALALLGMVYGDGTLNILWISCLVFILEQIVERCLQKSEKGKEKPFLPFLFLGVLCFLVMKI